MKFGCNQSIALTPSIHAYSLVLFLLMIHDYLLRPIDKLAHTKVSKAMLEQRKSEDVDEVI